MTGGASSWRPRPSTVTSREYLVRNLAFPSDVVKYADVGDRGLVGSADNGVTGAEGIVSCLQTVQKIGKSLQRKNDLVDSRSRTIGLRHPRDSRLNRSSRFAEEGSSTK